MNDVKYYVGYLYYKGTFEELILKLSLNISRYDYLVVVGDSNIIFSAYKNIELETALISYLEKHYPEYDVGEKLDLKVLDKVKSLSVWYKIYK